MTVLTRQFEDLRIGEIAESKAMPVLLEDMLEFARRYDPQYFHTDPEGAQSAGRGRGCHRALPAAVAVAPYRNDSNENQD